MTEPGNSSKFSDKRVPTTAMEFGERLQQMYNDAEKKESVLMIHLFGIKYAEQIRESKVSIKDIIISAGIGESYVSEVHKGVKLAKYVRLRNSSDA